MGLDNKVEFKNVGSMTKEEAIEHIEKHFKGNKKFIDQTKVFVYSTHGFIKINSMNLQTDNWNWEKFMSITVDTELGFKNFYYRKGNKKYSPENVSSDLKGNKTHDINEFAISVYYSKDQKIEEYIIPV